MKLKIFRQILILIIFCAATLGLHAQTKENHKHQHAPAIRQLPVDSAASIVAISYTSPPLIEPGIIDPNGNVMLPPKRPRYPGSVDTFGYEEVREILVIPKERTSKLKTILYALQCGKQPLRTHACYDPRNTILLLDKKGAIIAALEICFECLGYETKPAGIEVFDMRECKFDALKQFLVDAGIKYGTIPEPRK